MNYSLKYKISKRKIKFKFSISEKREIEHIELIKILLKKKKKKNCFLFTPCILMQRLDSKNKRVLTVIPRQRGEDDYV